MNYCEVILRNRSIHHHNIQILGKFIGPICPVSPAVITPMQLTVVDLILIMMVDSYIYGKK